MFKKFLLLASIIVFLPSCRGRDEVAIISGGALMMDTFVSVTIFDPRRGDEEVIGEVLEYMKGLERVLSMTYEGSDTFRVNNARAEEPVPVSLEMYEILTTALEWRALTNDLFDVTIGTVSGLWDFTLGASPPYKEEIARIIKYVGMDNILLAEGSVIKAYSCTKLDLGGIAKGFIADAAHDFMLARGVSAAVIDAGGDIRLLGTRPVTGVWTVGIEHAPGHILELRGGAAATSGSVQRNFTHDGNFYHHILDPATGFPRITDLLAVTATAENTILAEIISITAFMLGLEEGMEFVKRLQSYSFDIGAVFVDLEGNVVRIGSDGVMVGGDYLGGMGEQEG